MKLLFWNLGESFKMWCSKSQKIKRRKSENKFAAQKREILLNFLRLWGLSNFRPLQSYSYISIAPSDPQKKEKNEIYERCKFLWAMKIEDSIWFEPKYGQHFERKLGSIV